MLRIVSLLIAIIFLGMPALYFAQIDTSSLIPVLLREFDYIKTDYVSSDFQILSDENSEVFLFTVRQTDRNTTEVWTSGGTAETTQLIGTFPGTNFMKLLDQKIKTSFILYNDWDVLLANPIEKTVKKVELVNNANQRISPSHGVVVNDHFFFVHNGIMYISDGTQQGTFEMTDSVTGEKPLLLMNFPDDYCTTANRFFFISVKKNSTAPKVWSSDGTPNGTYALDISVSSPLNYDMVSSDNRVIIPARDGTYSTDGTAGGTFRLPIYMSDLEKGYLGDEYIFYKDELYWADRELSSIVKYDNTARKTVEICAQDSVPTGGYFQWLYDRAYWVSDQFHISHNGYKIELGTCEKTKDPDPAEWGNHSFYVMEDNDSVFVYRPSPGKRKIPLPLLCDSDYDSKSKSYIEITTHGLSANIQRPYQEWFFIHDWNFGGAPDGWWVVNPSKNTFRRIQLEGTRDSYEMYALQDLIFITSIKDEKLALMVVKL